MLQMKELKAEAAEKAAAEAAKAKEERVELMRRQATRRLLYADLAQGWSAWVEMWAARSDALQRLRQCGAKLHAPELSAAFGVWVGEHEAGKRAAAEEAARAEGQSLAGALAC